METSTDVQMHIMQKVGQDPQFRERLLADPKGVIEAETGRVLPDDALVFVQELIDTAQQSEASAEKPLSEDELIQVMGGTSYSECPMFSEDDDPWTHC